MGMEFFKKERKVNAYMTNVKGKRVRLKAGSGDEGARKKMIKIDFEIPITAKIRELLDPRLTALLPLDGNTEGAEREFMINSLDPSKQVFAAVISVYSKMNFNKDSKPIWSQGGIAGSDVDGAAKDEQASICLKKIAIKEDGAVLKLEVNTHFTDAVWKWAGDSLDGCDCVLKFKPLQGELFQEEEKKEEADEEDIRPESLKKKSAAKEKAAPIASE